MLIKSKPTDNEIRLNNKFVGKNISYKDISYKISRIYLMDGCCEPFHLVFFLQDEPTSIKVMVQEKLEDKLFAGIDNPDFKLAEIADLITRSNT